MRKTLDALRIGEAKLHWHGSSAERRVELVAAVAGLPVTGFVVVHVDKDADDRRHRRKCMEFLLPHLALMPCSTITFESRGQLDASDLDMLQKLRSRKVVESTVRIEHSIGRNEPALCGPRTSCAAPWCRPGSATGPISTCWEVRSSSTRSDGCGGGPGYIGLLFRCRTVGRGRRLAA